MNTQNTQTALTALILASLEELKATDITVLEIAMLSTIADTLIIASGSSNRQLKALANAVHTHAKAAGFPVWGIQGEAQSDWLIVDLGEVIVHLMTPRLRAFYNLEKLWSTPQGHATVVATP